MILWGGGQAAPYGKHMFLFLHLSQACKIQVGEKGRGLMHKAGNQEKCFLLQASLVMS